MPTVLLTDTTRWASSARFAIGLAEAGFDVSGVCLRRGHPLRKTRVVKRIFTYSAIRPLHSLINAIETTSPDLIIPCDDRAVAHLHDLHRHAKGLAASGSRIASVVERSLGSPQSYATVSARHEFLMVARNEGLRVPDMAAVRTIDDFDSWQRNHAFPWVLKADGTFGGRGVRIVTSLEQARLGFAELNGEFSLARGIKRLVGYRDPFWVGPWWHNVRPSVLVQAHIQGYPANCAAVCWKGKVLGEISVDVMTTSGSTGPATVVNVIDNREIAVAAERVASRLELSGLFGLDFVIDATSGAAYLIEINPRCTPVCHLQLGKGRDLAGALWAQLSGVACRDEPPVTGNPRIAYFPGAWLDRNRHLASSFQDVPWGEPDLVEELLHPWPKRTILGRVLNYLSSGSRSDEAENDCTLSESAENRQNRRPGDANNAELARSGWDSRRLGSAGDPAGTGSPAAGAPGGTTNR